MYAILWSNAELNSLVPQNVYSYWVICDPSYEIHWYQLKSVWKLFNNISQIFKIFTLVYLTFPSNFKFVPFQARELLDFVQFMGHPVYVQNVYSDDQMMIMETILSSSWCRPRFWSYSEWLEDPNGAKVWTIKKMRKNFKQARSW